MLTQAAFNDGSARLVDGASFYSGNDFDLGFGFDSDSALFDNGDSSNASALDQYDVTWALYDNDTADRFDVYDNVSVINQWRNFDTSGTYLYLSATPKYTGTDLTGTGTFNTVSSFIGGRSNGDPISSVTGNFIFDFDTAILTSSNLSVHFAAQTSPAIDAQEWQFGSLTLNSAAVDDYGKGIIESESFSTGMITNCTVNCTFDGKISGFAVTDGSSSDGFVLGFELNNNEADSVLPADSHLGGVLGAALFEGSIASGAAAFNYDTSYRSNFTHFGFAISPKFSIGIDTGNSIADIIIGNADALDNNRPRVISFLGSGGPVSGEALFVDDPSFVLDPAANASSALNNRDTFDVDWSSWTSGQSQNLYNTDIKTSPSGPSFTEPLIVVNVIDFASMASGTAKFSSDFGAASFLGSSTQQTLSKVGGFVNIDFSDADIIGGELKLEFSGAGNDKSWTVGFGNGSTGGAPLTTLVDGGTAVTYFNIDGDDFTSSQILDIEDVTTAPNTDDTVISGSIVGILSKDSNHNGLALAGGFNLFKQATTTDNAYGTFIWQWEDQFLTAEQREDFRTDNTSYGLLATASNDGSELSGLFGGPSLLFDTDGNSVDDDVFITNRMFGASSFTTSLNLIAGNSDSTVITSGNLIASEKTLLATSVSGVKFGAWNGDNSSTVFEKAFHQTDGSTSSATFGTDAFFVLADPIAAGILNFPVTGSLTWDSGEILNMQGQSQRFNSATETFWELDSTLTNHAFNLTLDFDTAEYSGDFSLLVQEEVPITWQGTFVTTGGQLSAGTVFLEADTSSGTNSLILSDVFDSEDGDNALLASTKSGYLGGYFVGDTERKGLVIGFSLTANGANLNAGATNGDTDRTLAGTILFSGNANEEPVSTGSLSTPEPTIEAHNINWRSWNNPIEENWVVVNAGADGLTELQTSNHLAIIDATPVANLIGSGSYGSSAASSFIGSGSAGDVTQVVAGLDVDFNTGVISNGNLQIAVGGSQAWDIDFAGSINNGMVDLNSIGGTLSDPGGLISNSIDANLGGVFTGIAADAFVGGFDLIDELNQFNQVDGLYTIER